MQENKVSIEKPKIYRNSECEVCLLDFSTPLILKFQKSKDRWIIICKDCYKSIQNNLKNDNKIKD